MLTAGGIDVLVVGFWRGIRPPVAIANISFVPLGRTYDARFGQRAVHAIFRMVRQMQVPSEFRDAELLIARNLEMLAISWAWNRRNGGNAALVYEVLDIHRMLLSEGIAGRVMRRLERFLMRECELLITSSPAFVTHYFSPRQRIRIPVTIVENRLLRLDSDEPPSGIRQPPVGPPWRIGWFGIIRCRKSFAALRALAQNRPDLVVIDIRGRPPKTVFTDLAQETVGTSNLTFGGPYQPRDLAEMYGGVHFSWAIDYFEEGGNSEWLLPNRLYEGCAFGSVPIALARTEAGRWLARADIGLRLDDPTRDLEKTLDGLSPEVYAELRAQVRRARAPTHAGIGDCRELGRHLADAVARKARRATCAGVRVSGSTRDAPGSATLFDEPLP